LVKVWVSVVPTIAPLGAVRDVPHAEPVETTIPAPGYVDTPVADKIPPENETPDPIVTLLNPPKPLPYRMDEPDVAGA
jgi:hypothetical protein